MKVAAYQAPLELSRFEDTLALIREQVFLCETLGVEILCCPEGVLGGLADYVDLPAAIAINVEGGGLNETVQALASDSVTTIVGFTEVDRSGRLFNAAAILSRGDVVGVYRKIHPAVNRSVYQPGNKCSVFTVGLLTFGVPSFAATRSSPNWRRLWSRAALGRSSCPRTTGCHQPRAVPNWWHKRGGLISRELSSMPCPWCARTLPARSRT